MKQLLREKKETHNYYTERGKGKLPKGVKAYHTVINACVEVSGIVDDSVRSLMGVRQECVMFSSFLSLK